MYDESNRRFRRTSLARIQEVLLDDKRCCGQPRRKRSQVDDDVILMLDPIKDTAYYSPSEKARREQEYWRIEEINK